MGQEDFLQEETFERGPRLPGITKRRRKEEFQQKEQQARG